MKNNLQPIYDVSDFKRDINNQALLSVDGNALEAYKKRREATRQITDDINMLKNEIRDIKELVLKLIGHLNA